MKSVHLALLVAVLSVACRSFADGREAEEHVKYSKNDGSTVVYRSNTSAFVSLLRDDQFNILQEIEPTDLNPHMLSVFNNMDTNNNGFVEKHELIEKLLDTYRIILIEDSDSQFRSSDLDKNGFITWEEYFYDTYDFNEDYTDDVINEEKEMFVAADMDSDGHLNETEFRYFYAPEDYLHMKPAVSRGILNRYDTDNNGYISFQEYVGEGRILEERDKEWLEIENMKFTEELDTNKDGLLDSEEVFNMEASIKNVLAEKEADDYMLNADNNHDGKLTFDEVLKSFYMSINSTKNEHNMYRNEL